MGFREIMTALSLIRLINELKDGDWKVFYHEGEGDLDEETARPLGSGDLTFAPGNFSYIVKAVFTQDGTMRRIRGEGAIIRFSYREKIQVDGEDVDKDDIYLSSHLDGDNKYLLLEFRFREGQKRSTYRFRRDLSDEDLAGGDGE